MNATRFTLLLLCSIAGAGLAANGVAGEKVILYGDDDYAPYSYVENGKFKGLYVDLLSKAATMLAPQFDLELQARPWSRGLAELKTGYSFGLFPPGLKAERDYIAPYSVPLYRETVVLFCNEAVMTLPRKKFPDDFAGLTIGVNAGFLLSARLMDAARLGTVRLAPAKGNEANLRKLALHRVACYASDRAAAMYSAKRLRQAPGMAGLTLHEALELSGEDTFIGYSANNNPPFKAAFIARMNATLEALRKSGETARIERAYLN